MSDQLAERPLLRRLPAVLVRERPRPHRVREHPRAWWLAVATVCFGAFMGQLDASVVTLTYGSLRGEFGASLAAVEWVSLGYLLTLVALLIPVGRLSDARGRKLLYLHGFGVFAVASAACGLAPSLPALIAFRVVQAAGAAMMQANSVALVVTSAPSGRTRGALGVQAAAQALGLALGPTVGGALVSTLGWRWVFGVNVPIGIVALVAGHYLLPRTRERSESRELDRAGAVLLTVATTAGLLGVSAASGLPVPAWGVVALFAVAVAGGWAFAARQRRAPSPLLDLGLLRVRAVSAGLAGALGAYLVLFGPLVLVPIVLTGRGSSELLAGLVLTALPAGFGLGAVGADPLLRGMGDRARGVLGAGIAAASLAALLFLPLSPGWLAAQSAVLGLGLGVFTPANNALIMKAVPARWSGTGGGLVNMARSLGTALGVAFVTLALHLGPDGGRLDGTHWAIAVLLAAALVTVAAAWAATGGRNGVRGEPG
ncbi:MFS transporter [Actinomadura napierensis]|uniref:MFS transporter n=1 Tax=Actinomadura napierensis TaxID=267854 RepID=A0ABN3AIZ8_9ACTN